MDRDSEATADMEVEGGDQDIVEQHETFAAEGGVSGSALASTRDDEAEYEYEGLATESDEEGKAGAAVQVASMPPPKPVSNRRSRASSPDWLEPPTLDNSRLTARQRARLEKEAGLAEDVQWHEMELPSELAYTWKGKGNKAPNQMTEEEWLKRQEGLERRRMRSLRDKREAEETIKAKLRKAVTARFRGKLGTAGGESGTEGEGKEPSVKQEANPIQPGWAKEKHNASGCSIAWHPNAHPLSYPMAVKANGSYPADPVDLPLQRPADNWCIPEQSSSSFKLGCILAVQQRTCAEQQQQQIPPMQQQQQLWFVDDHGWCVGSLLQQQVVDALAEAGYDPAVAQLQQECGIAQPQPRSKPSGSSVWQGWKAVVKSLVRSPVDQAQLTGVVVRLVPAGA